MVNLKIMVVKVLQLSEQKKFVFEGQLKVEKSSNVNKTNMMPMGINERLTKTRGFNSI